MSVDGMLPFQANSHGVKLKKSRGRLGGAALPAIANRMLVERLLGGMSIDGAPFFEAASHGPKKRRAGSCGAQPPICKQIAAFFEAGSHGSTFNMRKGCYLCTPCSFYNA